MKKSLIALAVASAFVAPAAMADTANVTIYGSANVSFDVVRSGDATAPVAAGTSSNQVTSNASAIGFKGSEDLGGGTSAIFQIESNVNLDGQAGSVLASNNSFAGLKGDSWGTLTLGQQDLPYKLATRGMDLFADTIADNRSIIGGGLNGLTGGYMDNRAGNSVAYVSPAMSGFTAAIAYVAGAEAASATGTVKGSAWSLAGMYGAGPINASVAYQVLDIGTAGTAGFTLASPAPALVANDKVKSWKVGGGYSMDAALVNLVYEKLTYAPAAGGGDTTQTNWYLSGKYNVSASDAVKAAYSHAATPSQTPAVTNGDAKQFSIGYDHNMSKRTTVYALYTKLTNNSNAASGAGYGLWGGDGVTSNTANTGFGSNPSAFSVGMKHSF